MPVKRLVRLWLAAGLLATVVPANAHGDWPAKHGGVMNDGGETSFELVARNRKVLLFVEDHGEPVDTKGAQGLLTVTQGERSWNADIRTTGGNRLEATLLRELKHGDKIVARVTMGNGSIAVGRFSVK